MPGPVRHICAEGLALVKHFESCLKPDGNGNFRAYNDGGGVLTIGWGHTGLQHKDGTVFAGRTITQAQADALLAYDMHQFEARVQALVTVPLSDFEHAALVSFDFNTGGLTLGKGKPSTLLRKLNSGDHAGAHAEFAKWNKDNGRVLAGLVRRRTAEAALFRGDLPAMRKAMNG
jgi:lysozyme